MTTNTRQPEVRVPPDLSELIDLDPAGVPWADTEVLERVTPASPLTGVAPAAMVASVQRVEPPQVRGALAWGISEGRTILFRIDETAGREFQTAIDAGEEPTAIVEPEQLVAMDIEAVR